MQEGAVNKKIRGRAYIYVVNIDLDTNFSGKLINDDKKVTRLRHPLKFIFIRYENVHVLNN